MTDPTKDNASDSHFDCQKHQIKMRASRARCADPQLYCKFRPACLIHFLDKERARQCKKAPGGDAADPAAK